MTYEEILKRTGLNDSEVVNCYQYGSRVYGSFRKDSDYDFIVIVKNKVSDQFSDNLINVNFFTPEDHQHRLDEHEISALECFFLAPEYIWKNARNYAFRLDLSKLRHSLCAKSSNSFVKAKKKITVEVEKRVEENPEDVGKKSLFHSFRIIEFGKQIAQTGKITDYGCSNGLFKEIMYSYFDWNVLFEEYKKKYNNLLTEFRLLAPK